MSLLSLVFVCYVHPRRPFGSVAGVRLPGLVRLSALRTAFNLPSKDARREALAEVDGGIILKLVEAILGVGSEAIVDVRLPGKRRVLAVAGVAVEIW